MKRKERQRKYEQVDKYSIKEKERYLKDLENSLYNYIRVGVENKQLEELSELESEFQRRYDRLFEMNYIMGEVLEDVSLPEEFKFLLESEQELKEESKQDEKAAIVEVLEAFNKELVEKLQDKWQKVIRDVAYMSHMNMIYNLYEKEKRQQKNERAYDKVTAKYNKLPTIVKSLSVNTRMSFTEICTQFDISEEDLDQLLVRENKYFNLRKKADGVHISLSPSGRKYNGYIISLEKGYSREKMEQLVYKNCNQMVEAIESSLNKGLEFELTLAELSPDRKRTLQYKYHNTVQKVLSDREESYRRLDYRIIKEVRENEIFTCRIGENWAEY